MIRLRPTQRKPGKLQPALTALSSTENGSVQRSETATSFLHATALATANGVGNGAAVTVTLYNPSNTAIKPKVSFSGTAYRNDDTGSTSLTGHALRNNAQDTDAVRFLFSTGNITSGTYRVWGFK